ncbi:TPA: hypothetical protein DDZ86_05100 [Candidatus Dependentiae bacterium]|nr:MAG: hypothetical protein A2Y17_09905 [Clostridiales bacterium GWF2_38_85]HBL98989.1 hypothetical protein [Candidatus Dependentiae bacterium]
MKKSFVVLLGVLVGSSAWSMELTSKKAMQRIPICPFSTICTLKGSLSAGKPMLYLPEGDRVFQKNQEIYNELKGKVASHNCVPLLTFYKLRSAAKRVRTKYCDLCLYVKWYAHTFSAMEWALQMDGFDEALKTVDSVYKIFLRKMLAGTLSHRSECSDAWMPCSYIDLKFKALRAFIELIYGSFWPVCSEGHANGWECCDSPETWFRYIQLKLFFMGRGDKF